MFEKLKTMLGFGPKEPTITVTDDLSAAPADPVAPAAPAAEPMVAPVASEPVAAAPAATPAPENEVVINDMPASQPMETVPTVSHEAIAAGASDQPAA